MSTLIQLYETAKTQLTDPMLFPSIDHVVHKVIMADDYSSSA
jgi:hypothetical protein